ncbi:hypothetical protein EYD10_13963 [Varanus komodoensis]|nr:hypothetical protein EYD10_13963 [Varanus komodoensis]
MSKPSALGSLAHIRRRCCEVNLRPGLPKAIPPRVAYGHYSPVQKCHHGFLGILLDLDMGLHRPDGRPPGFDSKTPLLPGMAMPCVLLITILGVEVTGKSSDSLESELECCMDTMEANTTCLASSQCSPGCYKRWNEDGSSSCVKCENGTVTATPVYNLTDCRNNAGRGVTAPTNLTTAAPVTVGVGGPEVAASLIFGTFVISLFLILCVASFFYLKRANKLPNLFYRRSKGSVVQSAESVSIHVISAFFGWPSQATRTLWLHLWTAAGQVPAEVTVSFSLSVRKPRYVRRERSLMSSGTATSVSAETRVSNV